jgi:hypothetical protein
MSYLIFTSVNSRANYLGGRRNRRRKKSKPQPGRAISGWSFVVFPSYVGLPRYGYRIRLPGTSSGAGRSRRMAEWCVWRDTNLNPDRISGSSPRAISGMSWEVASLNDPMARFFDLDQIGGAPSLGKLACLPVCWLPAGTDWLPRWPPIPPAPRDRGLRGRVGVFRMLCHDRAR